MNQRQNQTGRLFEKARLRLHLTEDGRYTPYTRNELAEMALEKYGPVRSPITCRRKLAAVPSPVARWASKIRALERKPGKRALNDLSARRLCILLKIRMIDQEDFEIDLRTAA